jgi:hypothetical protein
VPPITRRQFTCSDGSGTITAEKFVRRADVLFTHEEAVWAIVEGTGRYSTLRGKGTSVTELVSGDPADHIKTTFREIWHGVIDFDVTPPEVSISRASVQRLRRPKGSYSIPGRVLRSRRQRGKRGLARDNRQRLRCLPPPIRHDHRRDRLDHLSCAPGEARAETSAGGRRLGSGGKRDQDRKAADAAPLIRLAGRWGGRPFDRVAGEGNPPPLYPVAFTLTSSSIEVTACWVLRSSSQARGCRGSPSTGPTRFRSGLRQHFGNVPSRIAAKPFRW